MDKNLPIPNKYHSLSDAKRYLRIDYTREALEQLRVAYHQIRGQPGFMDDFLHMNPSPPQIKSLMAHPELVEWLPDGTAVFLPNGGHMDARQPISDPKILRHSNEGITLCAWFIHPEQLKGTVFAEKENRDNFANVQDQYCYAPSLEHHSRVERHTDQEKISSMEDRSGIPYLASVFDLNPNHLCWLKDLRKTALNHLHKKYGVDGDDHVALYFHHFIGEATTTLHLHVRVNRGVHPREGYKRLMLDDVIESLEHRKTVQDLLIEQYKPFYISDFSNRQFAQNLPGLTVTETANPFIAESLVVPPSHGKKFRDLIRGSEVMQPASYSRI